MSKGEKKRTFAEVVRGKTAHKGNEDAGGRFLSEARRAAERNSLHVSQLLDERSAAEIAEAIGKEKVKEKGHATGSRKGGANKGSDPAASKVRTVLLVHSRVFTWRRTLTADNLCELRM